MIFASINEYTSLDSDPRLAHVTATLNVVGEASDAECFAALSDTLPAGATLVRGSFSHLEGNTYHGFVYASKPVKVLDGKTPEEAGYRVMASNLYMDDKDESLWDVKSGAGGKYLVRQGSSDLSTLLETARQRPVGATPRLSQVQASAATCNQYIGYVSMGPSHAEMDYGVVLASKDDTHYVLSAASHRIVEVKADTVALTADIKREHIPKLPEKAMKRVQASRAAVNASADRMAPVLTPEEYWRLAFSYNADYMNQVLKQVSEMAYM